LVDFYASVDLSLAVFSQVCLLHEYVQVSLKTQPIYKFTELENAATPYACTVTINDIEYGREVGTSKKVAKHNAAR
jgi:microprocessor complex subunit DGCR8